MARSENRGLQCGKFETKSYRVEPLHPRRLICATGEGGARKRRIGGDEGRRIYRWRVLATKERERKKMLVVGTTLARKFTGVSVRVMADMSGYLTIILQVSTSV